MKGQIHSIEALTAAILFMFFLVTVLPTVAPGTDETPSIDTRVRSTLRTLDTAGRMRGPLLDHDLGTVHDRVEGPIVGMDQEVAALYLNTTAGRRTFSGSASVAFRVDLPRTSDAVLRIWYRDAEDPTVSVNGRTIASLTGTVADEYETYRLNGALQDGANTLQIDVSAASTVGYSVDRYVAEETGRPPGDVNIFTTSYFVAGANATFLPVEVTVASWR